MSLVGATIKFLSRKLANTSMREQIIIELATHGILEASNLNSYNILVILKLYQSYNYYV